MYYLADNPAGTGCWLGDPSDVDGRAWFSGDPKIITKCENYGVNPVKLALALTEALFTREEMAASNVRGTRGKESLDPSKIKAVRGNDVYMRRVYQHFYLRQNHIFTPLDLTLLSQHFFFNFVATLQCLP